MLFIAELKCTFEGKEDEIRKGWIEESQEDSFTGFEFTGNVMKADTHERNWDPKSFRTAFEIAVHRVLPGCEVVWRP